MDIIDKISFVYNLYDFQGMQSIPYNTLCLLFRSAGKGLSKICTPELSTLNISLLDSNQVDVLTDPFSPNLYQSTPLLTNYDIVLEYCCSDPTILSWLKFFTQNDKNIPGGTFYGENVLDLNNVQQSTDVHRVRTALEMQKDATRTFSSDFDSYYTPSVRAVAVQVSKFEKGKSEVVERESSDYEEKGQDEGKGGEEGMRSEEGKEERAEKGDCEEKGGDAEEEERKEEGEGKTGEGESKETVLSLKNTEDMNSENENGEEKNLDLDLDIDVDGIVEDTDDLSLGDNEEGGGGEEQEGGDEGEDGEEEDSLGDSSDREGGGGEEGEGEGEMVPMVKAKLLKTPYPFDSINYNK
jgi:hypothetical protein